jgi:hypothetical protein
MTARCNPEEGVPDLPISAGRRTPSSASTPKASATTESDRRCETRGRGGERCRCRRGRATQRCPEWSREGIRYAATDRCVHRVPECSEHFHVGAGGGKRWEARLLGLCRTALRPEAALHSLASSPTGAVAGRGSPVPRLWLETMAFVLGPITRRTAGLSHNVSP